jgi:hypothetical protein
VGQKLLKWEWSIYRVINTEHDVWKTSRQLLGGRKTFQKEQWLDWRQEVTVKLEMAVEKSQTIQCLPILLVIYCRVNSGMLRFFGGIGVWTQSFHLEPLHQPYFCDEFFEIGSHKLFAWATSNSDTLHL